jgi:hypothetical protein
LFQEVSVGPLVVLVVVKERWVVLEANILIDEGKFDEVEQADEALDRDSGPRRESRDAAYILPLRVRKVGRTRLNTMERRGKVTPFPLLFLS